MFTFTRFTAYFSVYAHCTLEHEWKHITLTGIELLLPTLFLLQYLVIICLHIAVNWYTFMCVRALVRDERAHQGHTNGMENQSIFIILWFGVHNTFNSFHFTLVNDFVCLYYLFILRVNFLFRFQFQFERKYAFRCAHQLWREKMQIICGVLNLPFTFTEQPKLECLVWTFMFYCFFASFTDTFRFTNHKIISCHPVDTSMLILCCVNNDYNSNVI